MSELVTGSQDGVTGSFHIELRYTVYVQILLRRQGDRPPASKEAMCIKPSLAITITQAAASQAISLLTKMFKLSI